MRKINGIVVDGHKRCTVCLQMVPVENYYSKSNGQLFGPCKPCNRARSDAWRRANPERSREAGRKWNKNNPRAAKNIWLKKNYGITLAEYEDLFERQGRVCAICKKSLSGTKETHVDHCHKTGKVRGLLCSNCNLGIGNMQEDKQILMNAIRYLELGWDDKQTPPSSALN